MKTKKLMVCNWNKTQYELGKKKVEPTDSWQENEVDLDATATSGKLTIFLHIINQPIN